MTGRTASSTFRRRFELALRGIVNDEVRSDLIDGARRRFRREVSPQIRLVRVSALAIFRRDARDDFRAEIKSRVEKAEEKVDRAEMIRRQRKLAERFYRLGRWFAWAGRRVDWIVGPEERAGMVSQIGAASPRSFTIVGVPHRFYNDPFDLVMQRPDSAFEIWRKRYLGATALGWWLARALGVVYVGPLGFLANDDGREWEFEFVSTRRRAVVCYFTGTDIRSPALMKMRAESTGLANIGSIQYGSGRPFSDAGYEDNLRKRAEAADKFADAIFTARVDQLSYLTAPTEPFLYFYPDENFALNAGKFDDLSKIVIMHAPSNPLLKGTDIIRAAMARIRSRFPTVEYVELLNVPNEEVLATLDRAHIVVNQLHAQMPGVFGIEAMARNCVMVCSADPRVETDLVDADDAWVVANPDDLEERLVELIEHPEALAGQARRGYDWAREHASASASGAVLRQILTHTGNAGSRLRDR